jgi:hypothetical protein
MRKALALAVVAGLLMVAACDTVDTTAPAVSIVNPVGGDTLAKGDIVIKAVATDNKAVAKVEFYVDGSLKGTDNVGGAADTFRYTWSDTAAQTAGSHVLATKAYDNASTPNTTTSANVTIYVAGGGSGTGPTEHSQDIVDGDSIWYPSGNPHIVAARIHINQNGKLTIKPGCIVKFETDCGFEVGHFSPGELLAVGTVDSTITFTSNNTTPNPGDWKGFDFYDQTRSSTQFSYCDINYGCYPSYAAVNIEGNQTIGMDHTTIHNSSNWGIWFNDAGGYMTGFTGNTITGCASYPLYIGAEKMGTLTGGNTLTGNGKNAIYVFEGNVTETGTWVNQGVPYFLSGNIYVASSGGAYLTIAKGTTVQFGTSVHLTVGQNDAGGLLADSVTFTSSASSPQKGDWYGIWFYGSATDAQCQLTRCNIGYGGGDYYANVYTRDAVPTITGCNIHDSKGWGIYLDGSDYPNPDSLVAHNTFASNDSGTVYHP